MVTVVGDGVVEVRRERRAQAGNEWQAAAAKRRRGLGTVDAAGE